MSASIFTHLDFWNAPIDYEVMTIHQTHSWRAQKDDYIAHFVRVRSSSLSSLIFAPSFGFQHSAQVLSRHRLTDLCWQKARRNGVHADIVTTGFKCGLR